MKMFRPVSIGVLSLLLGVPAVVCAQDDAKPPKQDETKQEEPKPEPKPHQVEPKQRDQNEPKDMKPEERDNRKPENTKQDDARRPEQEHPEAAKQDGHPHGRPVQHIPDDRFRSHFGREHTVVINRPVIVEGRPSFQFSGYWFAISDPWPVGWAYTDPCYVDYVDGEYFLFDVLHPGVRIALVVTD